MNEEQLAALAEKLYAQGLSDDDVAMHLDRAVMGAQPTPPESQMPLAYGMGLASGMVGNFRSGRVDPDNKAIGSPARYAAAQQAATSQKETADALQGSNPATYALGEYTPLLLSLITGGSKLVAKGARYVGPVARGLGKETKIGRGIMRGIEEVRGVKPPAPSGPAVPGYESGMTPMKADVPHAPATPSELEIPTFQRRAAQKAALPSRTVSIGPNTITRDPIAQKLADNAGTKAGPTLGQVQSALDKERRLSDVVKNRPQQGATKGQLNYRKGSMAARQVERVSKLSDAELQAEIANLANRKDAAAPMMREIFDAEMARRMGG